MVGKNYSVDELRKVVKTSKVRHTDSLGKMMIQYKRAKGLIRAQRDLLCSSAAASASSSSAASAGSAASLMTIASLSRASCDDAIRDFGRARDCFRRDSVKLLQDVDKLHSVLTAFGATDLEGMVPFPEDAYLKCGCATTSGCVCPRLGENDPDPVWRAAHIKVRDQGAAAVKAINVRARAIYAGPSPVVPATPPPMSQPPVLPGAPVKPAWSHPVRNMVGLAAAPLPFPSGDTDAADQQTPN